MTNEKVVEIVRTAIGSALAQRHGVNEGRVVPRVLPIKDTRRDIMHVLGVRHQEALSELGVANVGDLRVLIEQEITNFGYVRKRVDKPSPFYDEPSQATLGPFKGEYYVKE